MVLGAGDKVVADGVLAGWDHDALALDESSLTGESDPAKKSVGADPWIR